MLEVLVSTWCLDVDGGAGGDGLEEWEVVRRRGIGGGEEERGM